MNEAGRERQFALNDCWKIPTFFMEAFHAISKGAHFYGKV